MPRTRVFLEPVIVMLRQPRYSSAKVIRPVVPVENPPSVNKTGSAGVGEKAD